jgi:hypothetical protein
VYLYTPPRKNIAPPSAFVKRGIKNPIEKEEKNLCFQWGPIWLYEFGEKHLSRLRRDKNSPRLAAGQQSSQSAERPV